MNKEQSISETINKFLLKLENSPKKFFDLSFTELPNHIEDKREEIEEEIDLESMITSIKDNLFEELNSNIDDEKYEEEINEYMNSELLDELVVNILQEEIEIIYEDNIFNDTYEDYE